MIIDAHQHLWQIGRNGHEWPTPDLGAIHRDFGAADLEAACEGLGIDGTVLVQSQPSELDTQWMLEIAAATPLIKGVVGWTDLAAPDAPQRIAELAQMPKLKGLRPMLQGLPQDDWILRDEVRLALDAMTAHGLVFDALIFTRHLPVIDQVAQRHPSLRIVIDHGAKPPVAHLGAHPDQTAEWQDRIAVVAQNPNVACKLSGLLTEMAPGQPTRDLIPYAEHLLGVFGPDRLMWGSDWPVVLLKNSYRHWFDWTVHWLTGKPEHTRIALMGSTAQTLYSLN